MPFKIIRNDITKVKADAIVNTANPKPVCGGGTDRAVYTAAGMNDLLKARQVIGDMERGSVAVTDAFALNARYIIHTVGPVWEGGTNGEFETLENCYVRSLQKAVELRCESIAFPLISTGVYGFPKDRALEIAVSVFSRFLMEYEMNIILVVFDKKAFQLSEKIIGDVDSYIDANYVREQNKREYYGRTREIADEADSAEKCLVRSCREEEAEYSPLPAEESLMSMAAPLSLEDEFENLGASFHEKLFELIDKAGMDNKDVYKRANMDRKHFSKIQCDANYHPKKKTVMALCIGLQLDIDEARDLMARADWAFSPSSKFDLIVQKAIIDREYDIMQLNMTLFKYTNEILGV